MEDLIKRLRRAAKESFFLKDLLSEAADALQDVQPVKHGRWIQLTQNVEPTALKCSLCGEISCCHGMYCPDCGARMDGEENG